MGACEAHNLEAVGSKPTFASLFGPAVMDLAPHWDARARARRGSRPQGFFFVKDYTTATTIFMTIGVD